jgi:hypothetical protein
MIKHVVGTVKRRKKTTINKKENAAAGKHSPRTMTRHN